MNNSKSGWRPLWLLIFSAFLTLSANAANTIQIENAKSGTSEWQLSSYAAHHEIEGYASATSVNRGGQIKLFVNSIDRNYTIEIFRTGWYGGAGGRRMTSPVQLPSVAQPSCSSDSVTGLIECNWTNPYILQIPNNTSDPSDWASGVYLAKLTGASGLGSYIVFVVRDDARSSDYLFQSSVNTYEAYNNWGGRSLYAYNSDFQARKVSFNRPYVDSQGAGQYLGGYEYPMVRFLEREGYDVTYATDVDMHENPNLLQSKKADLVVGHGEYWSWEMRTNIVAARDRGVGLGIFAANTCYWQVRFEPSATDGSADRTIVGYKDFALREDPDYINGDTSKFHLVTTNWRASPVNLPEDALIGVLYSNVVPPSDIVAYNASNWVFNATGLVNGSHIPNLMGVEVDTLGGNTPPGTVLLSHSPYSFQGRTLFSDMTVYTAPSGATVFAAGTIVWSRGVDSYNSGSTSAPAQQMTRNILARLISHSPIVANPGGPYTGSASTNIQFDGSASTDSNGTIVSYQWNFGDGNTASGVSPAHAYSAGGTYTVILTVTDNSGASNTATTTATINSFSGSGQISLIQQTTSAYSATATVTVALNTSPRPGNALVLYSANSNVTIASVSGGGVTWTRGTLSGSHSIVEIWYGLNSTGSGATITINYSNSTGSGGVNVSEFSGVATSNALDVAPAPSSGISTTPTSPVASTSNPNDLILAATADTSTSATSGGPTGSFIALAEAAQVNKIVPAYRVVSMTGSYGTGWTETNAGWDAGIVALRAAPTNSGVSLASVSVSPVSVNGGNSSTGTVILSTAAPSGGATVTLSSNVTTAAQAPPSVTVPSGATSATFTVTTSSVSTSTPVIISGSYIGGTQASTLTVNPASSSGQIVFIQQNTAAYSATSTVVVTLSAAPRVGSALVLFSANSAVKITGVSGGGVSWALASSGGSHSIVEVWYGLNSSGSSSAVTVSYSNANGSGGVNLSEFSGVATSNALDLAPATTAGVSSTPTTPVASTTNANDLVLAAAADTSVSSTSGGPTNSFTALAEAANSNKISPAFRTVSSTGAYSTSWTEVDAGWDAAVVALRSQ